jgi:FKBP-type peptidyl-prolyl cis-trans isomerase SlyD
MKLSPEQAFGKKSAQLLKLISLNAFKKGKVMPEVGMQVEVDGQMGIVKTVTGGRVVVDFNHPLASKELEYTIKANKIITDDSEKIQSLISLTLNLKKEKIKVDIKAGKATVTMLKLPDIFQKEFSKKITTLVPTVKELVFIEEKQEQKPKQPLNTSKQ